MAKGLISTGAALAAVLMVACGGCGSNDISNAALPIAEDDLAAAETAIVPVAKKADSISPATSNQLPPKDADPKFVCRKFLDHLNQENADYFELLLTPAALTVSNRLDFHLPPVAANDSNFELSEPIFSTSREKLCYIESHFENAEDVSDASAITWMLRKTKSGWRVAGMLIPGDEAEIQNLLSFENLTDVQQIKESMASNVSAPATTQ